MTKNEALLVLWSHAKGETRTPGELDRAMKVAEAVHEFRDLPFDPVAGAPPPKPTLDVTWVRCVAGPKGDPYFGIPDTIALFFPPNTTRDVVMAFMELVFQRKFAYPLRRITYYVDQGHFGPYSHKVEVVAPESAVGLVTDWLKRLSLHLPNA